MGRAEVAAAHWRRLGLLPGAPECAIEAAWLWQIARHHPDRGGDPALARAINVARDELKGSGSKPNEYVAQHYDAQPWLVLGVVRDAEHDLAQRVGTQLVSVLSTHRRLADKVAWAAANFGAAVVPPAGARPHHMPAPLRPRAAPRTTAKPAAPATPGIPDGLPVALDLGTLDWGATTAQTIRLTWRRHAPYDIAVEAPAPLRADVSASKALPGRFVVAVTVDWEHDVFTHAPGVHGHTIGGRVVVRWAGGGEACVPVRGTALYPPLVSASPQALDLGTVAASAAARAALSVVSSGRTTVAIEPPAWLAYVDGDGRPRRAELRLTANTPVRLEFAVQWPPILDRAGASFAARRPVRPTGTIVLRWGDGQRLEVRAQAIVRPPRA